MKSDLNFYILRYYNLIFFFISGMNAGFEDCTILDNLFQKHNDNLKNILEEFSETRWEDTFAISDLALYNYIEVSPVLVWYGN